LPAALVQLAGFSALQRAENSSIRSRRPRLATGLRFSALQRAENSSIYKALRLQSLALEFQCSSASRKFLNFLPPSSRHQARVRVSVLFSEPKIPQSARNGERSRPPNGFQCSSASRKFLNALTQ